MKIETLVLERTSPQAKTDRFSFIWLSLIAEEYLLRRPLASEISAQRNHHEHPRLRRTNADMEKRKDAEIGMWISCTRNRAA
jgi:hypothetical protein